MAFVCVLVYERRSQATENPKKLAASEMFSFEDGKVCLLKGWISKGRYNSPENVFSCRADDFGRGTYVAQDTLTDQFACVAFYNSIGDFKKAEVMFLPGFEEKNLSPKAIRVAFDSFVIGILKEVDNAQGIEILKEEELENNVLFMAISIEKMSVLTDLNGRYLSCTRGYLVYQNKDKMVILSSQDVTLYGQEHIPKKHIENLKKSVLGFRDTFEFGSIPKLSIEKAAKKED